MKKKILVVDNHPVMLKLMTNLLEKKGYQVLTAEDGLSALDILKTQIPDIIFIDLVMPRISGKKLCRIIRKMPKMKNVYIIILSAIAAEEEVDFVEFGANACIAKAPFNEMAEHVLAALDQSDLDTSNGLPEKVIGLKHIYQRQITKELLSSKRHSEAILDNMSEGILELTIEGKIIYANHAAVSLIGIPEENLLASNFTELFSETQHKRIKDLLAMIGDKPQAISEDSPVILNSQQVSINIVPVKEEEYKSIIVIMNDITERKQAKEKFEIQRAQIKSLFDYSGEAMALLDLENHIIDANLAFEEVFGYPLEEAHGKVIEDLICPERFYYTEAKELDGQAMQRIKGAEIIRMRKDGKEINVHLSAGPIKVGGAITGRFVIFDDITKRKQAEEALRESKEKYRDIFENVSDFLYFHDLDGNLIETNLAWKREYGFSEDDLVNLNVKDLIPDRHKHQFEDYLKRIKENGKDEGLMVVMTKDGGERIVEYRNSLAYGSKGPVGIRGSGRDITERVRAKEALKHERDKLQDALAKVKTLSGMLPICSNCKKIRDDKGYWNQIESYIAKHTEVDFSHSICPECAKKLYPEFYKGD